MTPWGPVLKRQRPSQVGQKPAQRRNRRQPQSIVKAGARRTSERLKTSQLRRKERCASYSDRTVPPALYWIS